MNKSTLTSLNKYDFIICHEKDSHDLKRMKKENNIIF